MKIVKQMIDDLITVMHNADRKDELYAAIDACMEKGYADSHEIRMMAVSGFPIVETYCEIMQMSIREYSETGARITYSELCCIFGVIYFSFMSYGKRYESK